MSHRNSFAGEQDIPLAITEVNSEGVVQDRPASRLIHPNVPIVTYAADSRLRKVNKQWRKGGRTSASHISNANKCARNVENVFRDLGASHRDLSRKWDLLRSRIRDFTQRTHHLAARSADVTSDYISACLPVSEPADLETAQKFQNAGLAQELHDTSNTLIQDWKSLLSHINDFTTELRDSLGSLSKRRRKRLAGQVDECKRALTSLVQPSISLSVEQISNVDNSSVPGLMGAAVFVLTLKQVVHLDEIIEGRRATATLVNASDDVTATKSSSIFRSLVDVGKMIDADLSYTLKSSPEDRDAQVSKQRIVNSAYGAVEQALRELKDALHKGIEADISASWQDTKRSERFAERLLRLIKRLFKSCQHMAKRIYDRRLFKRR